MANVFVRGWNYFVALLQGKLDQWEDPQVILDQAMRDMKESQIKNRELAVQAITAKNNLQAEVDKLERLTADLEKKAAMAVQGGNRELALQFLKEKQMNDSTLTSMRGSLAAATEASEKVKIAIRSEEERFRTKTAEALALKANMKQAQIQIKINKALDQFQFGDNENQFNAVKDRVTNLQSEANARGEVAGTSMEAKMREMELGQMDVQAAQALEELEHKIALGQNPAANYNTAQQTQYQTVGGGSYNGSNGTNGNGNGSATNGVSAPENDLDRQLRELEEKLGKK